MVKSLFKMFNKPKKGNELLTELDISRVVGSESVVEETPEVTQEEALEEADAPMSNIETWKQNDLDLLQMTWEACCDDPENEESVEAFRSALHNLHGASGAYGGGALLRHDAHVDIEVVDPERRSVAASADNQEVRNVTRVSIHADRSQHLTMLFDPGHALDERILREQFAF